MSEPSAHHHPSFNVNPRTRVEADVAARGLDALADGKLRRRLPAFCVVLQQAPDVECGGHRRPPPLPVAQVEDIADGLSMRMPPTGATTAAAAPAAAAATAAAFATSVITAGACNYVDSNVGTDNATLCHGNRRPCCPSAELKCWLRHGLARWQRNLVQPPLVPKQRHDQWLSMGMSLRLACTLTTAPA